MFAKSFVEMSKLEAGSAKTQARVIEFHVDQPSIEDINPIRITSIDYSFLANGQTHQGSALGSNKVGETLPVLYVKDDPAINTPASIGVSEKKASSGLGAILTFFAGLGIAALVARILWQKTTSKTKKQK